MKKYGYVIETRETSPHYPGFYSTSLTRYAGPLRSAAVNTRSMAYVLRDTCEIVRRVELFKNGKPKRIISRK